MQRVKVYRLTSEGQWDDKGTGQVSVEYMEVRNNMSEPDSTRPTCPPAVSSLTALLVLHGRWGGQHCISHMDLTCSLVMQQSNTTGLVVIAEEQETRTLLIHEIQTQDIYQRQGGEPS